VVEKAGDASDRRRELSIQRSAQQTKVLVVDALLVYSLTVQEVR
jgi:hypothetical protein